MRSSRPMNYTIITCGVSTSWSSIRCAHWWDNHDAHLLTEDQSECVIYHSKYRFYHCEWLIHHTSLRMIFSWPIRRLSWVETLTDGLKSWNLKWTPCASTKYGLWLKHLWVWPNRLLTGMSIWIIVYYSCTLSREFVSSGRTNPFMD